MAIRKSIEAVPPSAPALFTALLILLAADASVAHAQTDYYNLDRGRPLAVEDAYATERYAFELQASPFTVAGQSGAIFYEPSLELKYGIFAGMELSAGLDARVVRTDGETRSEMGEVELSTLYNLNTETLGLPAFGVRVTGHVPIHDGDDPSLELKGALTRVLRGALRAHANGAWTLGESVEERWWAGLALDYVLPFRSLLLLGETYYAHSDQGNLGDRVHTAAGLRFQMWPRTGLDLGVGRDWSDAHPHDWHVTFGFTTAVGVRALMPR